MRNDFEDSDYSSVLLKREKKEKFLLVIFCIAASLVFGFYHEKLPSSFFVIRMFQATGNALAIIIPSTILTLAIAYFGKITKWHYVFAFGCFIAAFLMFLGAKY